LLSVLLDFQENWGYVSAMNPSRTDRAGHEGPDHMKMFRMPIRAVFYRENDRWFAHCLEMDLIGEGATKEEAVAQLDGVIRMQVEASIRSKNIRNLIQPADGKYFAMFAVGKDFAVGQLHLANIRGQNVQIDEVEAREYDAVDEEDCAFA
jgi:hypothetical protein